MRRNGGFLNGERERTVLDREGVPIATSQNSEWPFAARPLPITLRIHWKSITKRPKKQDSSILSVFWPGGGLNPYLIIITCSKARRGVRGGQFQNKKVLIKNLRWQHLPVMERGTRNVKLSREERRHSVLCVRQVKYSFRQVVRIKGQF